MATTKTNRNTFICFSYDGIMAFVRLLLFEYHYADLFKAYRLDHTGFSLLKLHGIVCLKFKSPRLDQRNNVPDSEKGESGGLKTYFSRLTFVICKVSEK